MRAFRNLALFALFVAVGVLGKSRTAKAYCDSGQSCMISPVSYCSDDEYCADYCDACGSGYNHNDGRTCTGDPFWVPKVYPPNSGSILSQWGCCQCEQPF